MSSRSRGRGGGRGFSRGGPPSRGGGREYYRGQGRPSGSRGSQDPDRLLSALGPEAKLALTQALVASVLGPESRNGYGGSGGGGNYREGREGSYRSYREGRGGYKEDYHPREQQRRHFGDDRRPYYQQPRYEGGRSYREEERGRGRPRYERDGKPPMGSMRPRSNYHKYVGPSKRRSSPHDHPGASNKRQRPEELDGRDKPRRDVEDSNNSEKQASNEDEEGKDLSGVAEGSGGKPSGVQVTIRADGERAVNSEGHVHVGGGMYRAYVELRCPHCPKQRSITFKEYKYHLASEAHKSQLNSLARKHSLVLRKIRVQQRQEQKDIEAKYKEEKPEEFKNAVTRFCNMCKLAFKNMPMEDNSLVHNRSKLHRIQRHYLHPRCLVCRITFPTRMVYEHHMASIKHLRALTAMLDKGDGSQEDRDKKHDSEEEELDLRNFMTLDSVGEDDDEVGSEHEEITGGLDVAEIAEEDLAGGDEEVEGAPRKHGDVGLAWEKLQLEDDEEEEEEDQQPLGTDYVRRIQAYFCSLCHKIIRGDSSNGARAVRKHCRGVTHISHYNELHPPEQSDAEVSGDEGEKAEECKDGEAEEAEGETEATVKEDEDEGEGEGEVEDEEAEGEEENEGEEAEADAEAESEVKSKVTVKAKANTKVKAKAGDKEAEETKVEEAKDAKEEEEEIDEEDDEGMADEKEEGWDEEVGDDFSAP